MPTVTTITARLAMWLLLALCLNCCKGAEPGGSTVVKPRYHHTWYKNHTYKKKWHIGRIRIQPEKQGVKRVKVKG
jgi:hypothetical protein